MPFQLPDPFRPHPFKEPGAPLLWFCMGLVMRKQGTNALHCLFCGQAGRDLLSLPGLKAAVPAKEHGPAFRSPYDTDIPDPALPAAPRAAGDANLDLAREILAGYSSEIAFARPIESCVPFLQNAIPGQDWT